MSGMQPLSNFQNLLTEISDINDLIKLSNSNIELIDQDLARIIRASKYGQESKNINRFKERCAQTLSSMMERVSQRQSELQSAQAIANSNAPGIQPIGLFVNRKDPVSINRYNQRLNDYNHQVEQYSRLVQQCDRAQERYDDSLDAYKDKEAELNERILEREEALAPALDSDIIEFIRKLRHLILECFHNKSLFFEGFLLLLITHHVYDPLYNRVQNYSERTAANRVLKQIHEETAALIDAHQETITNGFLDIVLYLKNVFRENEAILHEIEFMLDGLPYETCKASNSTVESLLSLPIVTAFSYQEVISPVRLKHIANEICLTRDKFFSEIKNVKAFASDLEPSFSQISSLLDEGQNKLKLMHGNKNKLDENIFEHAVFVLDVFREEPQQHLKEYQESLNRTRKKVEHSLGLSIYRLIRDCQETEFLTMSADTLIKNNVAFNFFQHRARLQRKVKDFELGIQALDAHLGEISGQPKKQADRFRTKIERLLSCSVFPGMNLVAMFFLNREFKNFSVALESQDPAYVELRKIVISRLRVVWITHLLLMVLVSCAFLTMTGRQKILVGIGTGSYALSSVILYLKRRRLNF